MNGIRRILTAQGRTVSDLARLTGLPERQIFEMMEACRFSGPSCFYMKVADALGISVEELIGNDSDAVGSEDEAGGMVWEVRFERKPDTICKIYLAKITGPHMEYRFDRAFRHVNYQYSRNDIYCTTGDLEDGVYETCARWYDEATGEMVHCQRSWFAVYDGAPFELEEQDVLYVLFRIEGRKSREM